MKNLTKKKQNKKPRVGLAFGGGSALGIAHVGVVKSLLENKIPIDCVSGTSAGAVVAACLAFGVSLKKMTEISKELNWLNISSFGYSKMGLESNEPFGKIIRETIGNAKIEDARIPLAIVATDIDTGEKIVFRKGNVAKAIMASACIPAFFVPVEIRGRKLVDGGLVENLPMSPLREMDAEVKIGIDLIYWRTYKKTNNVLDVIKNSYGILMGQQKVVAANDSEIIIRPNLKKFNSSDFKKASQIIAVGYRETNSIIPQIKEKLTSRQCAWKNVLRRIINFFRIF